MASSSMSTSDFQSLRSSCERCRFHKLKCTVLPDTPGEPTRCARCTRAKVECVFERRARGKRTRQALNDSRLDWGYPSPAATDSSGEAPIPNETPRSTDNYMSRVSSQNATYKPPPGLNPEDMNIDFLFQQNQGFDPSLPILDPSTYNLWNLACSSNVSNVSNIFDNSFSNPVRSHNPGIGIQLPSGLPRKSSTEPKEQSVPRSHSTSEPKVSGSTVRLSALVSDIQQTTINLENSEWAYNVKQSGLEQYPVGVVLQLAHEFSSILENLPRVSDSHMPTPPIQPSAPVDSNSLDASTKLQMTSCYLLLTKLYGIVFSQFHDYLKATPKDVLSPQLSSTATIENATLRLGDLTYSNDMWTKIYTVFRVMLDHLRNIGNDIGVPESLSIAQTLAGAEMGSRNAGVLGRISQAALEVRLMSKVQPLRVLLRERLAL